MLFILELASTACFISIALALEIACFASGAGQLENKKHAKICLVVKTTVGNVVLDTCEVVLHTEHNGIGSVAISDIFMERCPFLSITTSFHSLYP